MCGDRPKQRWSGSIMQRLLCWTHLVSVTNGVELTLCPPQGPKAQSVLMQATSNKSANMTPLPGASNIVPRGQVFCHHSLHPDDPNTTFWGCGNSVTFTAADYALPDQTGLQTPTTSRIQQCSQNRRFSDSTQIDIIKLKRHKLKSKVRGKGWASGRFQIWDELRWCQHLLALAALHWVMAWPYKP
ncbi:hypothetical protein FISHEDRAFT_60470 [Fistulina hepatica ATCC 64428]|uniref:Uncharacterized protein n=1 Tax=Fistulina hepatica ATCC 64428 TaxID=1128425 RepID=A0A0D7A6A5_9AGAR|nr:hypothetical protein FISHEDRAFT_60470 [Fistulina hepatica ATCC 64428]